MCRGRRRASSPKGLLTRVPENTIKFAVGLLLTSFGCFWGAEGAGVEWPGDELALLGVIAFFALLSFLSCARCAACERRPLPRGPGHEIFRSFGRFWWNFIVGDDWRLPPAWPSRSGLTTRSPTTASMPGGCSRPASCWFSGESLRRAVRPRGPK